MTKQKKLLTFSVLLCLLGGVTWISFNQKNDTITKEPVTSSSQEDIAIQKIDALTPSVIASNGKVIEKHENKDLPVEDVEEGSSMEKVIKLQKEIEELEESKEDIQDKVFILNNEISTYKGEMRKNDAKINEKNKSLANNLKWLFASKDNELLMSSLFNSSNIKDFLVSYNNAEMFILKTNEKISRGIQSLCLKG